MFFNRGLEAVQNSVPTPDRMEHVDGFIGETSKERSERAARWRELRAKLEATIPPPPDTISQSLEFLFGERGGELMPVLLFQGSKRDVEELSRGCEERTPFVCVLDGRKRGGSAAGMMHEIAFSVFERLSSCFMRHSLERFALRKDEGVGGDAEEEEEEGVRVRAGTRASARATEETFVEDRVRKEMQQLASAGTAGGVSSLEQLEVGFRLISAYAKLPEIVVIVTDADSNPGAIRGLCGGLRRSFLPMRYVLACGAPAWRVQSHLHREQSRVELASVCSSGHLARIETFLESVTESIALEDELRKWIVEFALNYDLEVENVAQVLKLVIHHHCFNSETITTPVPFHPSLQDALTPKQRSQMISTLRAPRLISTESPTDLSTAFMAMESYNSRTIILQDWFRSFVRLQRAGTKRSRTSDELEKPDVVRARFSRAVQDLNHIGAIRPNGKKTDQVARAIFDVLPE